MAYVQHGLPRSVISAQKLALLVSLICVIGFLIDIVVIGFPASLGSPQWRLNFLQQVADRSLLLCIGSALLLYSRLDRRAGQLRILSFGCLLCGLLVALSSVVVIEDNLTLQNQAEKNINIQASELRSRVIQGKDDPQQKGMISPEAYSAALESIQTQTASLQSATKTGAMKTLVSSAGNLIVVGIGLIGIGRIGLLKSFTRRR